MVLGYDLVAASWTKELEASKILVHIYISMLPTSLAYFLAHAYLFSCDCILLTHPPWLLPTFI